MHFDPWTLGLQAANFLVLVWLLHRFLYRPVLGIIAARQAAANKLTADLATEKQAAEALRQELEAEHAAIAQERDAALRNAHEAADAERKTLLAKARAEADDLRSEAQTAFDRERADAVRSMGQDAAGLAVSIARRLLRETPAATVQDRMLDLICGDVESLPADAKRQIGERLAAGDGVVKVITAAPLDEHAARRFTDSLVKALGASTDLALQVDPDLIAGVEVHFPFTVLRRSWSEDLKRIQSELAHDDRAANVA